MLIAQPPDAAAAMAVVAEALGLRPWSAQERIIRAVFGSERTVAVRSCHGAGKTMAAAACACAWLTTGPMRTVVTTAPTNRQVVSLLWKEIRTLYRAATLRGFPLGGTMLPVAAEWRIDDGWLAVGFASNNPLNLQGWHCAGGTLVIVDEAPGVELGIWDALHGVLVGDNDRLLVIGNPTQARGPFYDAFREPGAARIHVSAFETPNVVAGREVIPGLVTLGWVEERRAKWGEGSALYRSRVLGEFPLDDDNALVPLAWVEAANACHEALTEANAWSGPAALGLDVARYGADSTVAALAYPQGVRSIHRAPKSSTTETVGWVERLLLDHPDVVEVRVDADGLGAGIYDQLHDHHGDRVVEMRGGRSPLDGEHHLNARAEWAWTLRERLDPAGKAPLALPPDEDLIAQLTSIRWHLTQRGLVQVESKDDIRRRGMASPDHADAVAYALADMRRAAAPIDLGRALDLGTLREGWTI